MEPDHKELREIEDQDAQEYWEAGITEECLNALKMGGVDGPFAEAVLSTLVQGAYKGKLP